MEKKGSPEKQQFSIDILMGEYATWLKDKVSEKSFPKYIAVDVFFERGSFHGEKLTNQEKHFLELLPKLIGIKNKYKETYKDRVGKEFTNQLKGTDIISSIINGINDHLFNNNELTKTEQNHRSYANKFFDFITNNYISQSDKLKDWNYPPLSAGDHAVLSGIEGELYLPNVLRTKFKSRLRCQDRTSGDKIWLPLRFIGKLYSEDKRVWDKDHPDNKKLNLFSAWLDVLVNSIYIHYEDAEGNVNTLKFDDNGGVSLLLQKIMGKNDYEVYVIASDQNVYRVLTPTGKGNQKIPMIVKSISDIAIDHVKSIDSTLRDLSKPKGGLKQLKIVSDKYKEMQMEDEPDEDKAVKELVGGKRNKINLKKLKDELYEISNDGILRLMSSKYNSQKSNGDTFKKIVKHNKSYYGILEEDIKKDGDNQTYTLYQELTNRMDGNGVMRISSSSDQKLNGNSVSLNKIDINII